MPIGRERFESCWPRYLRHAKGEMSRDSWEDVCAHGTKRLVPYSGELRMTGIGMATVRDWRGVMLEAVEAGAWAAKTINKRPNRPARLFPHSRGRRADGLQPRARCPAAAAQLEVLDRHITASRPA